MCLEISEFTGKYHLIAFLRVLNFFGKKLKNGYDRSQGRQDKLKKKMKKEIVLVFWLDLIFYTTKTDLDNILMDKLLKLS